MCDELQYVTSCVKIRLLYRQPLHLTTTRNCRSPLQADFKEYLEGSSRRDINLLCSFELLNTHDIVNEAEEINGDSISMHPLCLISLLFCWLSIIDSKNCFKESTLGLPDHCCHFIRESITLPDIRQLSILKLLRSIFSDFLSFIIEKRLCSAIWSQVMVGSITPTSILQQACRYYWLIAHFDNWRVPIAPIQRNAEGNRVEYGTEVIHPDISHHIDCIELL